MSSEAPMVTGNAVPVQEVSLVIATTGDVPRLQGFVRQASERLRAKVLRVVGSWQETCVTLKLEAPSATSVLDELARMAEVQEAKEQKGGGASPQKQRILITLRPDGKTGDATPVAGPA